MDSRTILALPSLTSFKQGAIHITLAHPQPALAGCQSNVETTGGVAQ